MNRTPIPALVAGLVSAAVVAAVFAVTPPAGAAVPLKVDGDAVPSLAPTVERVTPAVVNIATRGSVEVQPNMPFLDDPFFRRFFGQPSPQRRETSSLGSGVIVDADRGIILTNHHVIRHADEITVTLSDDREFEAEVMGSDEATDVAVIRIEAENLTDIPLGDSDRLRVGDFVLAVGSPFGLQHTVTSGIVSALSRATGISQGGYEDFIQTDAAINPGNSGGALINLKGELVGINTAIFTRSGGNIGIGFAIPIDMARQVMEQLVEFGDIQRGLIGVNIQDLTPQLAEALGVPVSEGAVITRVMSDSPAEAAGLQAEDVVVAVDGEPVANDVDLRNRVGLKRIGTEVELTYYRDGERRRVSVVVGDPEESQVAAEDLHPALEGASFSEMNEQSPLYGEVDGILVTDVQAGSRAARGLQEGDVIVSVNKRRVQDLDSFRELVEGRERLLLHVRRGNGALFLLLQ